jgi:5-formyltetrahydrofolate cyclo-ligase
MNKQELRKEIRSILKAMKKSARGEKSLAIAEQLFKTDWWERSETLLVFLSFLEEVDTDPIIKAGLEAGKCVGVPRISGSNMAFHRIESTSPPCVVNRYGIREPEPELPLIDTVSPETKDMLIITPGLAFDRRLNRLGRGAGYYDRFIGLVKRAKQEEACFCGICFSEQLVQAVPVSGNDEKVDAVITDREMAGIASRHGCFPH